MLLRSFVQYRFCRSGHPLGPGIGPYHPEHKYNKVKKSCGGIVMGKSESRRPICLCVSQHSDTNDVAEINYHNA